MTTNDKVLVQHTVTGLTDEVPRFIFEHPVFGQYLKIVDENGCDTCGPKDEEVVDEVDPLDAWLEDEGLELQTEAPVENKKARDK